MTKTYTVFCQEASGLGTIWISAVTAVDQEEAEEVGRAECAKDWERDESDVHVLGVATGDVEILMWDDLNC